MQYAAREHEKCRYVGGMQCKPDDTIRVCNSHSFSSSCLRYRSFLPSQRQIHAIHISQISPKTSPHCQRYSQSISLSFLSPSFSFSSPLPSPLSLFPLQMHQSHVTCTIQRAHLIYSFLFASAKTRTKKSRKVHYRTNYKLHTKSRISLLARTPHPSSKLNSTAAKQWLSSVKSSPASLQPHFSMTLR